MTAVTLDQFLQQRETKPASEYACGEVYQKPMPDGPHSEIQASLIIALHGFLSRTGLGHVLPELRCIFGPPGRERIYVPDLVVVFKEHLPVQRHLLYPPEVAIEIL